MLKVVKMRIKDKLHAIEIADNDKPVKDILHILQNDTPDVFMVVEGGKIIGIVTDSDLIMKVKRKDLSSTQLKVKDIMTPNVVSIELSRPINEAVDLMVENNIQKLLVTDKGMPVGVIYGEDILDLDEDKWKELLFNQTIEEAYKLLILEPDISLEDLADTIKDMDKFANMESKVEFDLYIQQHGIIKVAYNYIKQNKSKPLKDIKQHIKENYSELLAEYSGKVE